MGNLIQALEIINSDNEVDEDFKNLLLVNLLKSSGTTFSLSDNLLNWARNQTKSIKIKSKRYFLNQSINENVDLFSPLADNKSITILINVPEKLYVCADVDSINVVLSNLFKLSYYNTIGTEGEKGSGLGLFLCKDFKERNEGTLKVECESGKRCRFTFSLPKK